MILNKRDVGGGLGIPPGAWDRLTSHRQVRRGDTVLRMPGTTRWTVLNYGFAAAAVGLVVFSGGLLDPQFSTGTGTLSLVLAGIAAARVGGLRPRLPPPGPGGAAPVWGPGAPS